MTILLSYRYVLTRFFGDSWEYVYELTLEKTYFFGLYRKTFKVSHAVSMFGTMTAAEKHWDELIKNKTPIK